MARRRAAIALVALTMIGTACTGGGGEESSGGVVEEETETTGPSGPQSFTVSMDGRAADGQNVTHAAFYPLRVKVRPGDTVVFENGGDAPHTVTFGASPLDPEPLPLLTKAGAENPVVFGPCFGEAAPPATAESCPTPPPATPPAFNGTGFWNSGVIAPASVPGGPHRFSMTIADGAPAGSYLYSCMLHKFMSAAVEVVENDIDRESAAEVAEDIASLRGSVMRAAQQLKEPAVTATGTAVVAGWGDNVSAINKFSPAAAKVKLGETVTWRATSPFEPHTVTFESPFKSPSDAGAFTPGGVKSGARYSGGFAHSGLFGPPMPGDSFSLTFTKAGTYSYICVLHPGMAGQIEVTP